MPHVIERSEVPEFMVLWEQYLVEQHKDGGEILPTRRTLLFFDRLAFLYAHNIVQGVAVMEPGAGVLLWGRAPGETTFDTVWGVYAQGWGTYVIPERRGEGISKAMRDVAKEALREKEIETVIGTVRHGNDAGQVSGVHAGFDLYSTNGALRL